MTSRNPRLRITQNWRLAIVVYQLTPSSSYQPSGSQQWNSDISSTQNPNFQNYLSLLITPKDATTNNLESNSLQTTLINNISPTTVTKNKSLAAIFPFELEKTINPPLFSRAVLEKKPITMMYTNVKVDGHSIKLILDTDGVTKTPIGEIDNFPIEVNGIIVPIKVLVMEATQYQALIGNNWLSSLARTVDTHGYQPSAINYNKLPPILAWDNNDNGKKKQRKEPTWKATIDAWTNNNQSEMPPILDWKEKNKEKKKGREENISEETTTTEEITSGWEKEYSLVPDKDYWMQTHYYCKPYHRKQYDYPKRQGKWDNKLCLACGKQLFNEGIDWVSHGTPITAAWHQAISHLDGYPHNENEIWQMVNVKVESALPSEILEIKNNPPEPTDIVLVLNPNAFIDLENSPEEFHEYYQNLTLMKKEQEQHLEEINT
ncbi:hypothetical protein G9A89_022793 [Geosiphon pyriformis]|nr:hypothetical protein G9A89_022793 [Geosiphon pyriformis]